MLYCLSALALLLSSGVDANINDRRLEHHAIAGYVPTTPVKDHVMIDEDQAAIETQLKNEVDESWAEVMKIYSQGGHSRSYAVVALTSALAVDVVKGSELLGIDTMGNAVKGTALEDAAAGGLVLKFQYDTSSHDDDDVVGCYVGGLVDTTTDGCLAAQGSLTTIDDGSDYPYTYTVAQDNKNDRTIRGFGTRAKNYDFAEYHKFKNYLGEGFADKWVTGAIEGKKVSFDNGDADFSIYGFSGRKESMKKGMVYLNVRIHVIKEFEESLSTCEDDNASAIHSWDKGVAFYTGSLEGTDGEGDGKLLHTLADKRCQNFQTCGEKGNQFVGPSMVNIELLKLFQQGQAALASNKCADLRAIVDKIVTMTSVPLMQGAMRYAYNVDKLKEGEKSFSEAAVFAIAVLPAVHSCSPDDAKALFEQYEVKEGYKPNFDIIKQKFENNYKCLGIPCAAIGGLIQKADIADEISYYDGADPCMDEDLLDNTMPAKEKEEETTPVEESPESTDENEEVDNDDISPASYFIPNTAVALTACLLAAAAVVLL